MNTDLRKKQQMILKKIFFKLMNNRVFGKPMEMRENIELSSNRKKKKLFSVKTKLSYYKFFQRKYISNRNEKN